MILLQVKIEEDLSKAIKKASKEYGVPASSLVKIVLTNTFMKKKIPAGNIFNAERDNLGKGLPLDDFIKIM